MTQPLDRPWTTRPGARRKSPRLFRAALLSLGLLPAFACGGRHQADLANPSETAPEQEVLELRRRVAELTRELEAAKAQIAAYSRSKGHRTAESSRHDVHALPVIAVAQSEPQRIAARKRVSAQTLSNLPNSGVSEEMMAPSSGVTQDLMTAPQSEDAPPGNSQGRAYRLVGGSPPEASAATPPSGVDEVQTVAEGGTRAPSTSYKTAEKLYEAALSALRQQAYPEATELFRAFLDRYPKHSLSDNSAYWLAEIAYASQDYSTALSGFLGVIEAYADGNKIEDSLLKLGLCYTHLGSQQRGQEVFDRLIRTYPDHPAASIARKQLEGRGSAAQNSTAKVHQP